VVLGPPTTFNSEVSSNRATWPARLQEKLWQAYPGRNIEVINASLGGYVSSANLKNLKHRVLPLDPDLVIYYEANNEIGADTGELAKRQGLSTGTRQPALITMISRFSLLFDLAYKNLAIVIRSRASAAGKIDRVPPDLPVHFISMLDEMRATLAQRNTPFLLSTSIVKYRRSQSRATKIANADVAFYYMPWMSIDGMLDARTSTTRRFSTRSAKTWRSWTIANRLRPTRSTLQIACTSTTRARRRWRSASHGVCGQAEVARS
jgi:hypothetical protein